MKKQVQAPKLYGKYRGKVLENIDPLFQGRILAEVPAVEGSLLNFALPCVPYAGPNVGFYAIPPIGANVWIEFEAGDPNYPIWSGCFWSPEDILRHPEPLLPEIKVFQTEHISMVLSDVPELGGFTLHCTDPAVDVPLSLTLDSTGITLSSHAATIKMTSAGIELTVPNGTIAVTPELISLAIPGSSIDLTSAAIAIQAPCVVTTAVAGAVTAGNESCEE